MTLALTIGLMALAQTQHDRGKFGGYFMETTTVTSGINGSGAVSDIVIARTGPQWDKLRQSLSITDEQNKEWSKLHGPLGNMDWAREQLVFARGKQQNSGGYKLDVQKVVKNRSSGWRVDLSLTGPKPGEMSIMMMTTPYVVFRMRRADGQPTLFIHPVTPK